jgi:AraC-like DNA-binding protein
MFPRTLLPLHANELGRLTGVRIPGDEGAGGLASSVARQLPHHLDGSAAADRARLGTTIIDLISIAMGARLGHRPGTAGGQDSTQRAMLMRVHAYIETRLADTELSPVTVAAAQHISVRYLHKLFETQQTTVAGWIRQRRLDHCRRDLLDPVLRSRPVSAIAARWGFTNPAHFSRVFRAAYDIPPGEYRVAAG